MTRNAVHDALIGKVTAYVREYMSHYDPSHDFHHIQRVVHLALLIQADVSSPPTSRLVVHLAALMHDVGDKKYLKPGEDASTLIASVLTSLGADPELAQTVQTICLGVSYSSEVKDPAHVARLIERHPELAVVQDADRLDAIGAVGIGRAFTFGGAKSRELSNTMEHFDDKLVRLEGMMKTAKGREMAVERTQRLRLMQAWWKDETFGIETI
ncbi:uncharacterized protein F5Z01DRAFT_629383 [Emericellopsis atlantica]|uniref:HD/PDEase domain-containing protein n=1 Tax=Emericellopsis atlantica TaxID=2614577 RepID=A0A9P7ZES6_9HYPO|nr:uncharacterized protein F5Z01DRAFT_629383 [Emericellopsis atlantica]KAG9250492.1 hypothetical protein F5Z01DRAFT_629383 [Emericellopsis atlantica]